MNVNWNADNGGWNVNANSVTNPNRWNEGNQVFSRNCCVSPPTLRLGSFAFKAREAEEPIVVPIMLKLMCTADGGALSQFQVLFTKPARLCATVLAVSTTRDLTSKHNMYRSNPPQKAQEAKAYYGQATTFDITVSALVAADYVSYELRHVADALLTTLTPALGDGPSNVQTYRFLEDGVPHLLTNGGAMLVYIYTGTSDSTWFPYMQWAELKESDLH